jgi:ATP-dependent Clp protease ATP-binding subunit ClpC
LSVRAGEKAFVTIANMSDRSLRVLAGIRRCCDASGLNDEFFTEFLTERARGVLVQASEAAREFKHQAIGPEHILLGLLLEDEGDAARMLESFELTAERVRAQIVRIVGIGQEPAPDQVPFNRDAQQVLELAMREALALGHNYLATAHVLLGLMRQNRGVAARILSDFEADPKKIRDEVMRQL